MIVQSQTSSKEVIFGFLTTIDSPLLPFFISSALEQGVKNIIVICDSKLSSEKDNKIWKERTGSVFDPVDNVNLYSFSNEKIPFYFVDNHNSPQALALIQQLGISCLFNAGTPRKLIGALISSVQHGIVNIHPGLLPQYRGCTAVEWAIFNDDKVGNTAHFMDEGDDTGPIISSEWYKFPMDADYQSIRVKVYREGCVLAGKTLFDIQESRMIPADAFNQDLTQGYTWSPMPDDKMDVLFEKLAKRKYRYLMKSV
jgi:methionyl-tRNA formyltransferase